MNKILKICVYQRSSAIMSKRSVLIYKRRIKMSVFQLENVTKTYVQGKIHVPALRGITLEIKKGDFMAIAGPSGSGKTTLLNIMGGLDEPTEGKVYLEGQDITKLSSSEISRIRLNHIGFVFQAYNLIPVLTAMENAEFVLLLQKKDRKYREEKVRGLFREVNIEGMEDRFPSELSGGQQQRVAIVRALAADPALILADEPTANLDSVTATNLLDTMEKLNKKEKATFIFSTHDHRIIERAKKIIYLVDGKIDKIDERN